MRFYNIIFVVTCNYFYIFKIKLKWYCFSIKTVFDRPQVAERMVNVAGILLILSERDACLSPLHKCYNRNCFSVYTSHNANNFYNCFLNPQEIIATYRLFMVWPLKNWIPVSYCFIDISDSSTFSLAKFFLSRQFLAALPLYKATRSFYIITPVCLHRHA